MLLRLSLKNFLSFAEQQEFNMFPNPSEQEEKEHVYASDVPLLKQAAIYGNNAAGKSNLVQGMLVLQDFARHANVLDEETVLRYSYQLRNTEDFPPVELRVEFRAEEKTYIYDVAFSRNGIDREALFLSGLGNMDTLVYRRERNKVQLSEMLQQQEKWKYMQEVVEKMLDEKYRFSSLLYVLSEVPAFESAAVEAVRKWFDTQLIVVTLHSKLPQLIELLSSQTEVLKFANDMFEGLSLGVEHLSLKTTDAQEWLMHHPSVAIQNSLQSIDEQTVLSVSTSQDRPFFVSKMEDGIRKVIELVFTQSSGEGNFSLDARSQSDGTIRILTLIPALYRAFHSEATVFIDEINHCLHPQLIADLVRSFSASRTKGQLIFTTHDTQLLEERALLRKDEVWLVEKLQGKSCLYPVSDFRFPEGLTVAEGYAEGRFGATYVGQLQKLNEDGQKL